MRRPEALDLFGGGGGAALGMIQAGFNVTGVDIEKKHSKVYPGRFVCGDALSPPFDLGAFDLIWASPPCQAYCCGISLDRRRHLPHFIEPIREMIADHPCTIIENVPGAPIRKDIRLSGPMVGLPQIKRVRWFETSFFPGLVGPLQHLSKEQWETGWAYTITKQFSAPNHYSALKARTGKGRLPVPIARHVMGIGTKMIGDQVAEAVAPPMARFVANRARKYCLGLPEVEYQDPPYEWR